MNPENQTEPLTDEEWAMLLQHPEAQHVVDALIDDTAQALTRGCS